MMIKSDQQRITQHKRFVPYSPRPNSAFGNFFYAGAVITPSPLRREYKDEDKLEEGFGTIIF
jgi:hypothetical protein